MQAFHENAEEAVRIAEVLGGMEKAFHDKDAAKFDGHFTDDAVFVTPAGAVFGGWPEIYPYHKENLEGITDEAHAEMRAPYTVTDADFLNSDTAVVHTRQTLTTPQWDVTNIGTSVLTKKDGAWRICALPNNNVARSTIEWANVRQDTNQYGVPIGSQLGFELPVRAAIPFTARGAGAASRPGWSGR